MERKQLPSGITLVQVPRPTGKYRTSYTLEPRTHVFCAKEAQLDVAVNIFVELMRDSEAPS